MLMRLSPMRTNSRIYHRSCTNIFTHIDFYFINLRLLILELFTNNLHFHTIIHLIFILSLHYHNV